MEQFLIFIDESGGFSYLDEPENCYVGGWVCKKARGTGDTNNFTLDFIRLPIKMLLDRCCRELGMHSSFSLEEEIAHLERLRPGTNGIMEKLGVRSKTSGADANIYDMAVWPPYYYA